MPRGVLQGDPELIGVPPHHRRPGDPCLVLARDLATGEVVPAAMRWGLPVASDPRRRVLHVRADQLKGKRLARRLRCLVPVGGYVQRGVKRSRIGVTVVADMTLAMAAIWSDEIGGPVFAIVTTEANETLVAAHERMPALLPPALWARWLDDRPLAETDLVLVDRPAPPAWLRAQALPRQGEEGPAASVAQQLQDWAPGSTLRDPRGLDRSDASAAA
ncbi:SOS response-associated peptidase family protein [Falsiroseomonas sp.]|uniref:SOS response-associated peptidase family protein n=1 Tax=Falsiroseomonas sp. TaxID=2870721 RepID=UPI0035637C9F